MTPSVSVAHLSGNMLDSSGDELFPYLNPFWCLYVPINLLLKYKSVSASSFRHTLVNMKKMSRRNIGGRTNRAKKEAGILGFDDDDLGFDDFLVDAN